MSLQKSPIVCKSPSTGPNSPDIWGIYEPDTGSIQYICACPATRQTAVIDVVWNFDPKSFSTDTRSMDQVATIVADNQLSVVWVLDTHPHADHVMASAHLRDRFNAPTAIGEKIRDIATLWRKIYNTQDAFDPERDFDRLFADGDSFTIGDLTVQVILSSGHTLGSITYVCGDAAFVHDTLMMPDAGTSRADFPGGDAEDLWNSIQTILTLPNDTRIFVGHDYGTATREEPAWEATVAAHKAGNKHVKSGTQKADYIKTRQDRDANLSLPERMLAALQINLRGGRLPTAESDGRSYLKMPVDRF
jgi:glyoxylase-like metal-dependent hydrolase (beta-lactamase superfamily II)